MARTSYIEWNDDDVRFILDQHAELDMYSARITEKTVRG